MKSQNKRTSVAQFFAPDLYEAVKIFDDLMESAFSFPAIYSRCKKRARKIVDHPFAGVGLDVHSQQQAPCNWPGISTQEQRALSLNRNVTRLSLFTRKLEVEHDLWCCLQRSSPLTERATTFSSNISRWLCRSFYLD